MGVGGVKEKLKYEPANHFFPSFLQVKPQFESRENKTCGIFNAIVYRTQVVAGINYFIKVGIYYRRECFVGLPHENQGPSLVSFQTGKTKDDPLTYF
ncbi:CYTX protein, partial [Pluvianellus socialis]|nr:CYTX protein [Pluvianellus socialis]